MNENLHHWIKQYITTTPPNYLNSSFIKIFCFDISLYSLQMKGSKLCCVPLLPVSRAVVIWSTRPPTHESFQQRPWKDFPCEVFPFSRSESGGSHWGLALGHSSPSSSSSSSLLAILPSSSEDKITTIQWKNSNSSFSILARIMKTVL